uniref:Transmembrane protein n=1 Tax=Spironucleus salmonicida TaxID=348837 RepID=V6LUW1_9EUKA|eukprot:EST47561.1 Hypothetical protein SS50377_fx064 [Spironucleus salmonicida]
MYKWINQFRSCKYAIQLIQFFVIENCNSLCQRKYQLMLTLWLYFYLSIYLYFTQLIITITNQHQLSLNLLFIQYNILSNPNFAATLTKTTKISFTLILSFRNKEDQLLAFEQVTQSSIQLGVQIKINALVISYIQRLLLVSIYRQYSSFSIIITKIQQMIVNHGNRINFLVQALKQKLYKDDKEYFSMRKLSN